MHQDTNYQTEAKCHMEIIRPLCSDLGVQMINVQPYYWKLFKLGCKDMSIMTITLTIHVNGKWVMGNTIDEVYQNIINNFK